MTAKAESTTKNIFQALNAIMNDVTAIEKSQTNAGQGFKFRGIEQFLNEIHPLFAKHGVIAIPTHLSSTMTTHESKSGSKQIRVAQQIKYTFYALDGSSVESIIEAEAMDTGDKGSTKAMSSALKYLLMQVFLVPTKDIEDVDAHSPEIAPDRKPMVLPVAPTYTTAIKDEVFATVDADALAAVWRKYAPLKNDAGFKNDVTAHGAYLTKPKPITSAFTSEEDFYAGDILTPEMQDRLAKFDDTAPEPTHSAPKAMTYAERKAKAQKAMGGQAA